MRRFLLACALAAPVLHACSCDQDAVFSATGALAIDPASLDFGPVFVGESKAIEVKLRNDGQASIAVSAPSDLALVRGYAMEPKELVLPAGGEAAATITFSPDETGTFTGTLVLGAAGATNEPTIAVTGLGVERAIGVPDVLDFGAVGVGEWKTLPLPIASASDVGLDLGVTVSGTDAQSFRLESTELALDARASGEVLVTFVPQLRGPHEAVATVSFCEGCADVTVRLRGEGAASSLVPVPDRLNFGVLSPGATLTLPLTLANRGDFPAAVGSALLADGTAPEFTLDASTLPADLAPGEEVELLVTFAPTALGERTGAVRVLDPGGVALFEVPAIGRGGGPDLAASPALLDFGNQAVNVPAVRRVTIANVGELEPVDVFGIRVDGDPSAFAAVAVEALPHDAGTTPMSIEVTFTARAAGTFAGELVVQSTDPDEPELRVPLAGAALDLPPCDLRVWPTELRFGLVHAGDTVTREVTLVNRGAYDCLVWDLALDNAGSPHFSLPNGAGSITIGPFGEVAVAVTYAPPIPSVDVDRSTVTFSYSNPFQPTGSFPVSGFATDADLVVVPNPVDFGRTPLGLQALRGFDLFNQGATDVTLASSQLSAGSSPDLTVAAAPPPATVVPAGAQIASQVRYTPSQIGADAGQVAILLQGAPEPLLVDVVGEGVDEPCGAACEGPTASCPGAQVTDVNTRLTIVGAGADPTGDPLTCTWRVVSAPVGSGAAPLPSGQCVTSFTPDIVGDYTLELTVRDPQGNAATCLMQITANPRGGLWVETFWDLSDDIDLHLLHPNAGNPNVRGSWQSAPWDCFYANLTPSWDAAGIQDDPSLDRDDIPGTGPENIRIDQPVHGHDYAVGIHWFSDANGRAQINVTTNIYCGAQLQTTIVTTMRNQGDIVHLGDVTFAPGNVCTWTPDGTVMP